MEVLLTIRADFTGVMEILEWIELRGNVTSVMLLAAHAISTQPGVKELR
jgi:hypothetical protein